jgi:hypothetical protein
MSANTPGRKVRIKIEAFVDLKIAYSKSFENYPEQLETERLQKKLVSARHDLEMYLDLIFLELSRTKL